MEKNRKKIVLPLFIAGIMVFSVFGVIIDSLSSAPPSTQKINYKGYEFVFDGQLWSTVKEKTKIEFLFNPNDIETVYTSNLIEKMGMHKKIYLVMSPKEQLAQEKERLRQIIAGIMRIPVVNACPQDEEGCENLPLKNCSDAVVNDIFIIKIEEGTENMIQEEGSCVAIIGNAEYLTKITEKIRLERLL